MPQVFSEVVAVTLEESVLSYVAAQEAGGKIRLPSGLWDGTSVLADFASEVARAAVSTDTLMLRFLGNYEVLTPSPGLMIVHLAFVPPEDVVNPFRLVSHKADSGLSKSRRQALKDAREWINSNATISIVGAMLGSGFTLTQLQEAFEAATAKPVDKRHFRRHALDSGLLEETGASVGGAHRPARTYRLSKLGQENR